MADLHILQLEADDDWVTLRDRLTYIDPRFVLLVWPPSLPAQRSKLDLLLMQRQATRLGKRIALVTRDPVVCEHARELNISVFRSTDQARRERWKRPRDKVFTGHADPVAQAELAEHIARLRTSSMVLSPRVRRLLRWAAFVTLLLAILAGMLLAVPSATVVVTPASDQVFVRVPIVADPNVTDIDIENRQMPATILPLQINSRVTLPASGYESAGASLSQGLVVFTNTTSQPLVIPLGTIVTTSDTYPIRFETLIETTLPAGPDTTVQVPVQALNEHAGAAGNVNPGEINRLESNLAGIVTATNPNATYGGAVQERRTVTAEDHERLLVLARQQVLQDARDTLLLQLSGEKFLVPGSIRIVQERPEWTIYSAFVGDITESVSLDLRADVQAVVVDEQQARQVAYSGLAPYIRPGLEVAPEALTITRGDILEIEPDGRVSFLMVVEGNIAVAVDEQAVRSSVAGTSVSEAQRRLQRKFLLDPEHPPQITTQPSWFGRLPWLPIRISVQVKVQ